MLLRLLLVVGMAVSLCVVSEHAAAHDLKGTTVERSSSASPSLARAIATTPTADFNTRSVLNNLRLWPMPRQLTICFLSGTPALRKRVAESMRKSWQLVELTDGRLGFDAATFDGVPDCPQNPSADIRVGFKNGDGHWSYVGVESRLHNPSMNFGGFIEEPPEQAEFDRIVGHEFGHALGLEHEHQSPNVKGKCKWNFDYIFKNYSWKNEAEMHHNMDALQDYITGDKHAYVFSTYDKRSLMHYFYKPAAFVEGSKDPCYIKAENRVPSAQDKDAMRVAYGPDIVAAQARTKGMVPDVIRAFPGAEYGKVRDLLNLKSTLLSQ